MVDLILVMSVNPGFGGQAFIPAALDKICATCARWSARGRSTSKSTAASPPENAADVVQAGANVLVAGSAVFKGGNYKANIARSATPAQARGEAA